MSEELNLKSIYDAQARLQLIIDTVDDIRSDIVEEDNRRIQYVVGAEEYQKGE